MSTLALAPVIVYLGGLKYQELSFDNGSSFRLRIENLPVLEYKKIKEYDEKKTFENWLRVSGSKLNVS